MGQKIPKGSVSITNNENRIRLRWRYQQKRYSINLFNYSKENLIEAKKIALTIQQDMLAEQFDETLARYKPAMFKVPVSDKSLVEHFEYWVRQFRNMDCETDVDYNSTRNMMRRWRTCDVSSVVSNFNNETFSATTYNRRLTLLKKFFTWTTKTGITTTNPLEDVLVKKTRRTPKQERKPFTEEEIRKILAALKNDTYCPSASGIKHSHYYPFLYFIFKTGVRNAEAIGLRVKWVDTKNSVVHIREALVRSLKGTNAAARIRKDTKNGKHRILPLTEDLRELITPLLMHKQPDDLVFQSPTGLAIDDHMFQTRIFSKILKELGIEHRVLYACRHTFASRCIESGMTPVQTAFLMGNNPETALRNYTHQISLPDNLPKI